MTKAELTRKLNSPYFNRMVTIRDSKGNKVEGRIQDITEGMLTISVSMPNKEMGLNGYGTQIKFAYWHKNIAEHNGLDTTGKRNYDWYLFQINNSIIYSCPEIKGTLSISF